MASSKQLFLVSEIAALSSGPVPEMAAESPSCLISSLLMGAIAHQTPEPGRVQEGPWPVPAVRVSDKRLPGALANIKQQT